MMGLICSPTAEGRSLSGSARPFPTTIWITAFRTRRGRRSSFSSGRRIHIRSEEEAFVREGDRVYRNNVIARECVDKRSGNLLSRETLKRNHALVLYEVPEDRIMEEI